MINYTPPHLESLDYSDLIDDYYQSDQHVFQDILFGSDDSRAFVYEYMSPPGEDRNMRRTWDCWGIAHWQHQSIWEKIADSQLRGPMPLPKGRQRVSYRCHVRINSFYRRKETTLTYIDLDYRPNDEDAMEHFNRAVEALRSIPNLLWCRSPNGGFHIFLIHHPIETSTASDMLMAWFRHHGIHPESNITFKKHAILETVLVPGQDPWTLPCEPGAPDNPVAFSYDETVSLFAEMYRNRRMRFEDAFGRAISQSTPEPLRSSLRAQVIRKAPLLSRKRSRNLKGSIPGILGPLVLLKDAIGNPNPQEYLTPDDCINEADGLRLSLAYGCALLRKHSGDVFDAENEFIRNRHLLRPSGSSKHQPTRQSERKLVHHAKSMFKFINRDYDPDKLKHSGRSADDREALLPTLSIDIRHQRREAQRALRSRRAYIIKRYGRAMYRRLHSFMESFIMDINRNAGRIAKRSTKSSDEYTFADSRCLIEYDCIGESRRLLDRVMGILKDDLTVIRRSDKHNHVEAKCTRYDLSERIVRLARDRQGLKGTGKRESVRVCISAGAENKLPHNVRVQHAEPLRSEDMPSDFAALLRGQKWTDYVKLAHSMLN